MKIFTTLVTVITLAATANAKSPNIIFLMSDDQTTYSMGCYGNKDVQTPNLDQLSADGITFDNHYVTTAICMASRATVMTGMHEFKTGTNFSHGDMMLETWQQSYPVLLRKNGYHTAFAGKFGFVIQDGVNGKTLPLPSNDFDRWGGGRSQTYYKTASNESMKSYAKEYPHSTLSYGAFAQDFIQDSVAAGQPFCLSVSFKAPHKPASPDPRFNDVYKNTTFTKPENYGREHGEHFAKQSQQDRQYKRFVSWGYADNYNDVMATYHQQIYAIDVAVGMIRKQLEESGVAENTIIIYTSDNGFFCGSHGYASKVLPYEDATRVPLIIYDPRHHNSGKSLRSDSLTANIDFAPTMLKLGGVNPPDNMDGADLMDVYQDTNAAIHESLPLINVWGKHATRCMAVVTKEMKYIYWPYAGEGFEATEELYHLQKDPLELTNLAQNPEYSSALNQMRKKYDKQHANWRNEAVPYNRYQEYSTIFDRNKTWADKAPLYSGKNK
jgi:arylsulfatase A-like enzyme